MVFASQPINKRHNRMTKLSEAQFNFLIEERHSRDGKTFFWIAQAGTLSLKNSKPYDTALDCRNAIHELVELEGIKKFIITGAL